ncbi:hypothetical protein O9992_23490 [Vibrio lentus]|nr:hypothetical protein [Vibrio lentus]
MWWLHDCTKTKQVHSKPPSDTTDNEHLRKAGDQPSRHNDLLAQVEPNNMVTTIESNQLHQPVYTTSTGVAASDWLLERWETEIKDVPYASARQITHAEYPQKSVEVTLPGAKIS